MINILVCMMLLASQDVPSHWQAMDDGNWLLAETLLRQLSAAEGSSARYGHWLGFVLDKQDRSYEAMEQYGAFLSLNSERPLSAGLAAVAIRYADLSRQFGHTPQADATLERFEIENYRGLDRKALDEFEPFLSLKLSGEAIAAYCAAENLNSPTPRHEWPGLWHTDLAARAVRLAPQWPDAWERLGERLSQDGWNNKAWVAFHEALRRYPSTEKQKIINVRNRIRIMEAHPRMVEVEDPNDPTGYRMVNVELPGKRFRDGKDPNPRSNIAWPLPGPVPPDWH
jgi:hypothetical protein